MIFQVINGFVGINFGAYSLSVLVFPMLQQWMRKDAKKHENNLKQAIGLFAEVVKQYLLETKGFVKIFKAILPFIINYSSFSSE